MAREDALCRGCRRRGRSRLQPSWLAVLACVWLLSGCLLMSGETTTIDLQEGAGNVSTRFVSAEGTDLRNHQVAAAGVELQVIAIVAVESGDLALDLLDPSGSVVFSVAARPGAQITRSGLVPADEQGRLRYRVTARGARDGNYQLFFQP